MLLISSLCEGYHWTVDQAMSITMPQAIMLNHASWVSRKSSENKFEAKRELEKRKGTPEEQAEAKRIKEMSSEQTSLYMSQLGNPNF